MLGYGLMDRHGKEQVGKLRDLWGDAAGGDSPPAGRRHNPDLRVFGALAMAWAMVLMLETAGWAEPRPSTSEAPQVPGADKLTSELRTQLEQASPEEMVACLVMMKEPYPFQAVSGRSSREKIDVCRATARQSQAPVLDLLRRSPDDARVEREYWVINGFYLLAKPEMIRRLSAREDIKHISHIGEVHLVDGVPSGEQAEGRAVEWGVQKVNAPACWNEGFDGQGVIIAHTDTGVDTSHPALQGKFTGYWHDSINGRPDPYDDHGHGTHTMGTILGGDGNGPFTEDIGVAPGATFVTAKILNSSGTGTDTQVLDGMQYIADLKETVDLRVMSASWADSNPTGLWVWDMCQTFKSIGILSVFAIGNDPNANPYPPPGTAAVPGNYPLVLGVGATDSSDNMAYFSLRGPAPDQSPWNDPANWYRPDWNRIKPDISGPGVSVRSSLPGGQYAAWNGTSMATPHVAGTVAILCQKNPTMDLTTIYNLILDSADQPSQGAPYPNNAYGWGRLNAYAALQDAPGMNQPWISITQMTISDPAPGGNGNGQIEPGETARLVCTLKNIGGQPAYDTTLALQSQDNYLTVGTGNVFIGDLDVGEAATHAAVPLTFTAHDLTPQGHVGRLLLTVNADGGAYEDYSGTKSLNLQIGPPPPPLVIFADDLEYGAGESFADFWTVTGNWTWTSGQSHSPTHSAYSGSTALDNFTYLTQKNAVDLSNFREASLTWWHKYDFSDGEVFIDAEAAISVNGGAWQNVWAFDFVTEPDSISWTEKKYALIPTPGLVKVRFGAHGHAFFQDVPYWWIDDLTFTSPDDVEPPYFNQRTVLTDTISTGPYTIQANVTDHNGVAFVQLYYRVNGGAWNVVAMTALGGDDYQAQIPAQSPPSTVDYYLSATDQWVNPNTGADPVGAPSYGTYSFDVVIPIPEACCFADDTCQDLPEQSCDPAGGRPQGTDTSCATVDCSAIVESCCRQDGTCGDISPFDCLDQSGIPGGPGTDCSGTQCPQPVPCCYLDGSCAEVLATTCSAEGGTPKPSGAGCLGDNDGDGTDDGCELEIPGDLDHDGDVDLEDFRIMQANFTGPK